MSENPFNLNKKYKLKTGARLGSKKNKEKTRQISVYLKLNIYEKIVKILKKDGILTLSSIINDCLEKNL